MDHSRERPNSKQLNAQFQGALTIANIFKGPIAIFTGLYVVYLLPTLHGATHQQTIYKHPKNNKTNLTSNTKTQTNKTKQKLGCWDVTI